MFYQYKNITVMSIILFCILSWNKASNILIKFLKGSKYIILSILKK